MRTLEHRWLALFLSLGIACLPGRLFAQGPASIDVGKQASGIDLEDGVGRLRAIFGIRLPRLTPGGFGFTLWM